MGTFLCDLRFVLRPIYRHMMERVLVGFKHTWTEMWGSSPGRITSLPSFLHSTRAMGNANTSQRKTRLLPVPFTWLWGGTLMMGTERQISLIKLLVSQMIWDKWFPFPLLKRETNEEREEVKPAMLKGAVPPASTRGCPKKSQTPYTLIQKSQSLQLN